MVIVHKKIIDVASHQTLIYILTPSRAELNLTYCFKKYGKAIPFIPNPVNESKCKINKGKELKSQNSQLYIILFYRR